MHAACGMLNAPEREGELICIQLQEAAPSARDRPALCLASTVSRGYATAQTGHLASCRMDPMQGELGGAN